MEPGKLKLYDICKNSTDVGNLSSSIPTNYLTNTNLILGSNPNKLTYRNPSISLINLAPTSVGNKIIFQDRADAREVTHMYPTDTDRKENRGRPDLLLKTQFTNQNSRTKRTAKTAKTTGIVKIKNVCNAPATYNSALHKLPPLSTTLQLTVPSGTLPNSNLTLRTFCNSVLSLSNNNSTLQQTVPLRTLPNSALPLRTLSDPTLTLSKYSLFSQNRTETRASSYCSSSSSLEKRTDLPRRKYKLNLNLNPVYQGRLDLPPGNCRTNLDSTPDTRRTSHPAGQKQNQVTWTHITTRMSLNSFPLSLQSL